MKPGILCFMAQYRPYHIIDRRHNLCRNILLITMQKHSKLIKNPPRTSINEEPNHVGQLVQQQLVTPPIMVIQALWWPLGWCSRSR